MMAMNPKGDYLKELNRQGLPSGCDFRIITSEFEPVSGSNWKRHLRDLVVDKVFRGQPNDLIVPTDADWEQNLIKTRLVLDKSKGIDHSTYWSDDQVIAALEPDAEKVTAEPSAVAAPPVDRAEPAAATDPKPTTSTEPSRDGDAEETRIDVEVVHGSLEHAEYPIVVGHQQGAPIEGAGGICRRPARWALEPPATARALSRGRGSAALPPAARDLAAEGSLRRRSGRGGRDDGDQDRSGRDASRHCVPRCRDGSAGDGRRPVGPWQEDRPEHGPAGTSQPTGLPVPTCVTAAIDASCARTSTFVPSMRPPNIARLSATAPDHRHRVPGARRRSCRSRRPNPDEERSVLARRRRSGHAAARRRRRPVGAPGDRRTFRRLEHAAHRAQPVDGTAAHDSTSGTLQYTLMGGQAGAPVVEHVVDMTLLEPLLADAEKRPDGDAQIQNTLFELLFPREIKLALATGGSLNHAARRRSGQLSVGDARQAATRHAGVAARANRSACKGDSCAGSRRERIPAAVDPAARRRSSSGTHPVRPTGPPLNGACEEAAAVAKILLGRGYEVTRLIFDVDGDARRRRTGSGARATDRRG